MSETSILNTHFPDVAGALTNAWSDASAATKYAEKDLDSLAWHVRKSVENALTLGQILQRLWRTFFINEESDVAPRARAMRADFLLRLVESLEIMRRASVVGAYQPLTTIQPGPSALAELLTSIPALESILDEAQKRWGMKAEEMSRTSSERPHSLRLDKYGDIRVGNSRVLLDTILEHFKAGLPTEDIIRAYDTVQPADVHDAIAYYLRHKDDVEAYLQRRDLEAAALRQAITKSQPSSADLKAKIQERWSKRRADHDPASE